MVKTTVRTIRIDQDLNDAIENIALENNTSVNFVVNSAIREHIEWSSVAPKLGFGMYPRELLTKLFEKLSEKECEEFGKTYARDFLKPFLEYRFGSITFENYIRMAREFSKYNEKFKLLTEMRKDAEAIVIFEHGAGIKWSHFFKGIMEYIGETQMLDFKIEVTSSKCSFRSTRSSVLA